MDYAKLFQIIDNNKEDMIQTLASWIRIPSVKAEPAPGAPMGEAVGKMLEKAMADCKAIGLDVRNFDGFACDARMGKLGVDPLAILAHIDVVPTGDNWEKDPFSAEIEDGYMYGRGTQDDKGPAVAALYAMKAIQQAGIPLKREVRMILGTDEESGWECMKYYKAHCDMPRSGFSPDASFPVINTEKGQIRVDVIAKPSKEGLQVLQLYTGERSNVIPGKCLATVKAEKDLIEKAQSYAKEMNCELAVSYADGIVTLETKGKPGHAAMPEGGRSAVGLMLRLLDRLGVQGAIKGLAQKVGSETYGESLGIQVEDKTSGPLTLNIGIIRIDAGQVYAVFDIRFPVLADYQALLESIRATLSPYGFTAELKSHTVPHHVSESSELVQKLLQAYNEETGENAKPFAIGGGTYAKVLDEGVAYGSLFPGEEELAHQAGERCSLENLHKNVKIFAKAIVLLAGDIA